MREALDNYIISTIRTVVPTFVGTLIALLTSYGFEFDDAAIAGVIAFVISLCVGGYYLAVRLLASRFPKLEWLLGAPKKPTYEEQL